MNLFGEFNDDSIVEYMNENYCVFEYGANSDKCDGDYTCADDHDGSHSSVCVLNQYVVRIFLAVYMMLAAVLMLNLLVAGKALSCVFHKHTFKHLKPFSKHFFCYVLIIWWNNMLSSSLIITDLISLFDVLSHMMKQILMMKFH